ncbi:MAG TPA: bifunctional phosphoglucose/phosphomannose isomerase [bacterium]|nr:bifunctional phosphoglucose/phosphomannose isomerase [bacterium]
MILDDKSYIEKIDKSNMLHLIEGFDRQCIKAGSIKLFPVEKRPYSHIVFCGMGGSAIAGDILKKLVEINSSTPFFVHRDYGLPNFVGKDSLVIVVSYSGNTEETIDAYQQAIARGSTVWVLSSGGNLEERARADKKPYVKIPAGQPPRCSLGYLFFPVARMLYMLGIIKPVVAERIAEMATYSKRNYGVERTKGNRAKKIATIMHNRNVVIYSGNFLYPAVLRWKTQLAENSKHSVSINCFPEMNHNEIMAWSHPKFLIENSVVFFFYDANDCQRVKLRMDLTRKIFEVKSIKTQKFFSHGRNPADRIFSLIMLGDWVSFYLAILNGMDPTEIKEISYLKKKLSSVE